MKDKELRIHGGQEGILQGYLVERSEKELRLPRGNEG